MNTLPPIEPGTLLLIVAGLCVLGVFATVIMPLVGTLFDLIGFVAGLLMGDPSSCCGCILFLMLTAVCGGVAAFALSVLSTCGTPQAVNFCTWFGR
jgi:hypothetical protein